jgi:hypothetical protein
MTIERRKPSMRELSSSEIEAVSGGVRAILIGAVLREGARLLAKAVLSGKHSGGDACDYYNNMPAGMQ